MPDVKIVIGADLCPIEGNTEYFERGDAKSLFGDLLPEFQQADLVVANLECPLIDRPSPIVKTGPTFGESTSCIRGIHEAGVHLLCLANNHIMDHGPSGLESTIETCERAGVQTVGAGRNLEAARKLHVSEINGFRVAVLAMAEHEFSIAGPIRWGANPLDTIEFVRTIRQERERFDYLIVLLHGSAEFQAPTPKLQKTCRFMIEMGAGAVVVQHPHVLGGIERYQGGHIVYGQGALIMDEAIYRDRPTFHEGFLVKFILSEQADSRMEIVPFVQSAPLPGARKLSRGNDHALRERLKVRSEAISDSRFVADEWKRYCQGLKHSYMSHLLGHNRVLRRLNRSGLLERALYANRTLISSKNVVLCETHREVLETLFDDWISEKINRV